MLQKLCIYFFGTVEVSGIFFSAILFNFVVKRAMGSRLLEGLPICPVQPPMLQYFFSNRVVALYDYWIVITDTDILIDHPSVIQIYIGITQR